MHAQLNRRSLPPNPTFPGCYRAGQASAHGPGPTLRVEDGVPPGESRVAGVAGSREILAIGFGKNRV